MNEYKDPADQPADDDAGDDRRERRIDGGHPLDERHGFHVFGMTARASAKSSERIACFAL